MPATPILVEKTTVHPRQEEEPPQRIDSFPSLSMEGPSDDYITDDEHDLETGGQSSSSPSSSSSSLTEENERLRAQVAQLKDKVTALQNRSKHKRLKRANSETDVSVVLELSLPNLRQGRNPSHNASPNHNHNPKPRQSPPPKMNLESFPQQGKRVATHHDDNDRGMMEPQYLDLETHRSCDGLHHRSHYHPNNRVSQSQSLTPIKRKPKGLALLQLDDDDDPFPSKSANLEGDDDDNSDDDCEQDGLLTRTRSSSNENNIIINNDDDQEDFVTNLWDRAGWLVGLLVLQSMSSFILARNEALLQEHTIIVRFLTMLVGAGGNAGNQASVRVIRGLAVGSITDANTKTFLRKEVNMGICLSLILGTAGFIRAAIFMTPMLETFAITTSLFMIVSISIVFGAVLPLVMKRVRIDPAHSSTTIQVIMDILGVTITVFVSRFVYWMSASWSSGSFMDA